MLSLKGLRLTSSKGPKNFLLTKFEPLPLELTYLGCVSITSSSMLHAYKSSPAWHLKSFSTLSTVCEKSSHPSLTSKHLVLIFGCTLDTNGRDSHHNWKGINTTPIHDHQLVRLLTPIGTNKQSSPFQVTSLLSLIIKPFKHFLTSQKIIFPRSKPVNPTPLPTPSHRCAFSKAPNFWPPLRHSQALFLKQNRLARTFSALEKSSILRKLRLPPIKEKCKSFFKPQQC